MNPVYLVDHSNFAYKFRNVHSWARVSINGVSVDTSVVVGYLRALKSNPFKDIAIVLDGVPEYFDTILPGYKGQRNHEKEDKVLSVPFLEVVQFLSTIGPVLGKNIFVVASPLQEADQVISSIAHLVSNNVPSNWKFVSTLNTRDFCQDSILSRVVSPNLEAFSFDFTQYDSVVIGTTDADMAQLQRFQDVYIDTSTSGKSVSAVRTADSVNQLPPAAIPIYKAIFGDVSDNIPALPLNNSLRKDSILTLIKSWSSKNTPELFYQCVLAKDTKASQLVSLIYNSNCIKEFKRNWEVCFLKFYSVPFVLKYTDFSIDNFIEKYKLRL